MARVNTDILGISELKWTGLGKFNPNNHGQIGYGKSKYGHFRNQ